MADYIPAKDGDLRTWLNNFSAACQARAGVLGLDPAELAEIADAAELFGDALELRAQLAAQAKGASAGKQNQRNASIQTARRFAQEFQKNPAVTDALRGELGLSIPGENPAPLRPQVPTFLTAMAFSNGNHQLSWHRNGNVNGTQFIIEAQYGNAGLWEFVDVVTRTDYVHVDQIPGEMITYRVFAKRVNQRSGHSNEATVYAGGNSRLSVAA